MDSQPTHGDGGCGGGRRPAQRAIRCFPSQDFRNKFRNVIEPFWNAGSKLPEYSDELLAAARYDGTTIGDPPFNLNQEVR